VNVEPALYLIPTFLGDVPPARVFPPYNIQVVERLRYYVAEREKTARAFIKKVAPQVPQSELHFFILNKHTDPALVRGFLEPLRRGEPMGLLSEAGMPGIADPGAPVVRMAHREGRKVEALVGPSSLFLALAASGLNGQQFAFHGYLPVDSKALARRLKELEHQSRRSGTTQIFIETPYRNRRVLQTLVQSLSDRTLLGVASHLTLPDAFVRTLPVGEWKKTDLPDLHKKPTVFLFQAGDF